MATYLHRAYDPVGEQYVHWTAEELDLDGSFYVGPPDFSTLVNPTLLRRILGVSGFAYDFKEVVPDPLIEYEEVP